MALSTRSGGTLALLLICLPAIGGCGLRGSATAPVVIGGVTSGVSASGTLDYVTEQKIGFPMGGKLTALRVKVGDRVAVGQPVAEVENLEQRQALRKAQDQVQVEQIRLNQAVANNRASSAVEERRDNQEQADTARRSVEAIKKRFREAIDRIGKRKDFNEDEVDRFQARLDADRPCLREDSDPLMPGLQVDPACVDRVRADKDALRSAQAQVLQDRVDLSDVRNSLKTEGLDRELLAQEKARDRNNARNNADFERGERGFNISAQRLVLDSAQADLATAQKAFQDTIKPSAYSGTVDHINGQVGQVLVAARTPLLPGDARSEAPVGSDLIVLKDVNAYQVVVAFSEFDGSRITPDKAVEVSFDEVPGLVADARIASVEPPAAGAKSRGYLVTTVLNNPDSRLRDGMRARVTVVLDRVDNTLVVPVSAVQVQGRTGMVTLVAPDGRRRDSTVELGMVNDRSAQILSGLAEHDQVVADRAGG